MCHSAEEPGKAKRPRVGNLRFAPSESGDLPKGSAVDFLRRQRVCTGTPASSPFLRAIPIVRIGHRSLVEACPMVLSRLIGRWICRAAGCAWAQRVPLQRSGARLSGVVVDQADARVPERA